MSDEETLFVGDWDYRKRHSLRSRLWYLLGSAAFVVAGGSFWLATFIRGGSTLGNAVGVAAGFGLLFLGHSLRSLVAWMMGRVDRLEVTTAGVRYRKWLIPWKTVSKVRIKEYSRWPGVYRFALTRGGDNDLVFTHTDRTPEEMAQLAALLDRIVGGGRR